jgi:putative endonuclease
MFYIYYIQSKNNFYIGYTKDLRKRLDLHNKGKVSSTKPYIPWKLVFYEAFPDMRDAKRREEYLKTTKGRKALKLMLREYFKE